MALTPITCRRSFPTGGMILTGGDKWTNWTNIPILKPKLKVCMYNITWTPGRRTLSPNSCRNVESIQLYRIYLHAVSLQPSAHCRPMYSRCTNFWTDSVYINWCRKLMRHFLKLVSSPYKHGVIKNSQSIRDNQIHVRTRHSAIHFYHLP